MENSVEKIFKEIMKHEIKFESKRWDDKSVIVKEFIRNLLEFNPEDRPTATECLKKRWVRKFSRSKACGTNIISKTALRNLQKFHCEKKLQHAILAYIANFLTSSQNNKAMRETFLKLDKDNDGVLSRADLKEGLSQVMGNKVSPTS